MSWNIKPSSLKSIPRMLPERIHLMPNTCHCRKKCSLMCFLRCLKWYILGSLVSLRPLWGGNPQVPSQGWKTWRETAWRNQVGRTAAAPETSRDCDHIPTGTASPAWHSLPALGKGCSAPTAQLIMEKYGFITTHFLLGRILLGANLLSSLCLDAFSLSVCGAPHISLQKNWTKTKGRNVFSAKDVRRFIFLFESIAV